MQAKPIAIAALLAFAAGAQAGPADKTGWYGDIDLSHSHTRLNGSNLDQVFANQGITTNSSIDRNHSGFGVDLGYRFSDHFALEGGYMDFGKFSYSAPATAPAADTIDGRFRAHAWSLSPTGWIPLGERWTLFGKAGLTRATASLNATSETGATAPTGASHTRTGWLLGGGTTFDFTQHVFGRLEADRYGRVGDVPTTGRADIDTISVGVGVRW